MKHVAQINMEVFMVVFELDVLSTISIYFMRP